MDMIHDSLRPLRPQVAAGEIIVRRREIVAERIFLRGIVHDVGLVEQRSVDEDMLIDDAHAVAGKADDTLHVVRVIVERKLEDDNVASPDRTIRKEFLIPGARTAEDELVDQQMVADE